MNIADEAAAVDTATPAFNDILKKMQLILFMSSRGHVWNVMAGYLIRRIEKFDNYS